MLPKCSLIQYICINAFDYNAIIVYFTVRKPGTLYETWYYPSYVMQGAAPATGPRYTSRTCAYMWKLTQ